MPILDKLNKKLDEAGVEEHGCTIEEAVDLLPAMGGGGMQLEQIGTTHNVGWIGSSGGGTITYYKLNDYLCAIQFNFGGSPAEITANQKITLDTKPNIQGYTGLSGTPSATMIAVTDNGEYRHLVCTIESTKLHIINPNDTFKATFMSNMVLMIAAPVENPT